jgi:hypothetical protein
MFPFCADPRSFLFHDLKEVRDGKQESRESGGITVAAQTIG